MSIVGGEWPVHGERRLGPDHCVVHVAQTRHGAHGGGIDHTIAHEFIGHIGKASVFHIRHSKAAGAAATRGGLTSIEPAGDSPAGRNSSTPGATGAQRALEMARETGNRRSEAIVLGNLGNEWRSLGQFARARRDLEQALRLMRSIGDRQVQPAVMWALSCVALIEGDAEQALTLAEESVSVARANRSPQREAWCLLGVGHAALALGRNDDAAAAFEESHRVALVLRDATALDAAAGPSAVAVARGDLRDALRRVAELQAHVDAGGNFPDTESQQVAWLAHQALTAAGQRGRTPWLERAHDELQRVAASLDDPELRRGYLENHPMRRAIADAWNAASDSAAA